jgi:hypothetical protein
MYAVVCDNYLYHYFSASILTNGLFDHGTHMYGAQMPLNLFARQLLISMI